MFLNWLEWMLLLELETYGHLNNLNSETIQLHYVLARRLSIIKWRAEAHKRYSEYIRTNEKAE